MKTTILFITILLATALLSGCGAFSGLVQTAQDVNAITPSDNIITESRDVSGFDTIEMSTFGKVILTQGDTESLTITGSDNIVPLVHTSVRNGKLMIEMDENLRVINMDSEKVLTFDITVRDLTGLTVSGLGNVQMDALSTTGFNLVISGAGGVTLDQLLADRLEATLSGLGNLDVAGQVNECKIEIPGAGNVKAGDLECQSVTVNISGLGSATVWATEQLTGSINGGGSVSYYGNPQADIESTGLGEFEDLGEK